MPDYVTSQAADDAAYADAYGTPVAAYHSYYRNHYPDCPCEHCFIGRGNQQPSKADYAATPRGREWEGRGYGWRR